jgi:hypothetical protein
MPKRLQCGLIGNAALSAFFGNFIERICAPLLFFIQAVDKQVTETRTAATHIVVFLVNSSTLTYENISVIKKSYFYVLGNFYQGLFLLMTIENINLTAV